MSMTTSIMILVIMAKLSPYISGRAPEMCKKSVKLRELCFKMLLYQKVTDVAAL